MALCKCIPIFTRRRDKNKGTEKSSKKDIKTLHAKIQQPHISSDINDLKSGTLDVTVPPTSIQKISRSNIRVMSLESPVKAEAEDAYEGGDEHDDSPSVKWEVSDFDLQVHEVVTSEGGYDHTDKEMKFPRLYHNKAANIQLEGKDDTYSKTGVDTIQSGHVSDPGICKADFSGSPKLTRSCSNLERTVVLREKTLHFLSSNPQSFEDLQDLSANQMANVGSPQSVMTHLSADKVMLKRHSSSQVLPSRSKRLWWKLFIWSHRNIHRLQLSKSTQLHSSSTTLKNQCGYSSDTLEPKNGKALMRRVESTSPGSSSGEYFDKSRIDKNTNNQRWSRFHSEGSGFSSQNQWVAFTTESSPFNRVDQWVKGLEVQQPLPEDNDDNNMGSIVYPPSPEASASMAQNTAQFVRQVDANLSKEILTANSMVQSLSPASTVAHISGIGIKVIPAISHFFGLRSVNLSSNFIVNITPGLLPKGIHTLNLSRNNISTIEGLRELTRLRVLYLSYNRISRIGQGLSSCTLIKELYLAGNKISDVEGLHRLLKLTVLDLSFNKITTTKALGQLVANYNSLQVLNLHGNPIERNISDDQLRKKVCGLLPKLVYLNKQPVKPRRGGEVLPDSVAKAALGSSSWSNRRAPRKGGHGQGASSFSNVHRSSLSVAQRSKSMTKYRTKNK
ncbi:putative leucine-rich repeat domain, L domain-containing protein [Lupinus albus]|uniref:Putative leucine-rich repeat domain, L domain-containing protein n=1 Tax=Lupinus albus TaxID=3870 RepID=A0A6A4N3Y1_LUPAL|nr:putative leucine-rich repeat domain, L domain-containing protein [Lupinus albus]